MILKRSKIKSRKVGARRSRRAKKIKGKPIFGKKVKIGFFALAVGAVLFGIFRFLSSSFFSPLLINVSIHQCGEYACLVEGNVEAEVGELFGGKNLIFTDFGKLVDQYKDQNLVVAEVHYDRSFLLRKLEVEVVGRRALAVVKSSDPAIKLSSDQDRDGKLEDEDESNRVIEQYGYKGGEERGATESAESEPGDLTLETGNWKPEEEKKSKMYFVDEEGIVFAEAEDTFGLPVVPLPEGQTIEVGDRIEGDQINTYLEILKFLDKNKITIQNLEIETNDQVLVYVSDGPEVTLSTKKDIEKQIGLLAVILQRYRVEGEKLKKVDLRFDKPVVQY